MGGNSEIVRAESRAGPSGPFAYVETVVPYFAHGPSVRWDAAAGLWYMQFLGCGVPHPTRRSWRLHERHDRRHAPRRARPAAPAAACSQFNISRGTRRRCAGRGRPRARATVTIADAAGSARPAWWTNGSRVASSPAMLVDLTGGAACLLAYRADAADALGGGA